MVDLSALAKWPNVPACTEWLSLDRRGDWRLQGERVTHRGLIEFMNRQYGSDEVGRWFVQNGPQRVYVDLACTPWIFRRAGDAFISHTGQAAGTVKHLYLDESGNLLLDCELGIGLLDDRDLPQLLSECCLSDGTVADETAFEKLFARQAELIFWRQLPMQTIAAVDLPVRYKFEPRPRL